MAQKPGWNANDIWPRNHRVFLLAGKRQRGRWVCVALTYSTAALSSCSEESVSRKKPWWIRMELRLPEPGAGNSAQSSEQKALQEERLSREMLVAGETFNWVRACVTWKVTTGSGLLIASRWRRAIYLWQREAMQPSSWGGASWAASCKAGGCLPPYSWCSSHQT